MKLHIGKFALVGGLLLGLMIVLITLCSMINIPGFVEVAKQLTLIYGFYGYSVSWIGVLMGAIWGFLEGFVWFGIFAWLYNVLLK